MSHPLEVLRQELADPDQATRSRQRARLIASLDRVHRRPRWPLVPVLVSVALALAWALKPAPRLPAEVGSPLSATATPTELSFPDGSRLTLAPETRAHLEAFEDARAEVVVDRGLVTAQVRKGTHRVWRYHAGPFTVTVVGTVLSVGWTPERAEVEVAVSEGRVSVSGPGLDSPLFVGPGESLRRVVPAGRAMPAPEAPPPFTAPRRPPPTSAPRLTWQAALWQSRWREALELAEAAGVLSDTRPVSSDELLALADAARLDSRPELALRLLGDVLDRRGAGEAQAAFMRGQLLAERRRLHSALEDFERSLAVEPKGSFAQNALGRSIDVNLELGDTERARSVAQRYLTEYPEGPWSQAAARVVKGEVVK